ncbi:MAG: PQQ-dependent sugar dehydrogenase [Thermoplasmata archaeon]
MRRLVIVVLLVAALVSIPAGLLLLPRPEKGVGELALESLQEGLAFPVSLAMTEDGRIFYNELREGGVRILRDGELLEQPFVSLDVVQLPETGLLGIALDPSFATQPFVYLYYTYTSGDGISNRISRFRDLGDVAGPEEILLDNIPANSRHNSGRLLFGPDGKLYASVGDALDPDQAQDPSSLGGKILRINPDGSVPQDNPLGDTYSYLVGIRNVFGMDFTPGGLLLFTENGPAGNDELNRGRPGLNYGWPVVQGEAQDQRFEDPILVFNPSIAPTGLAFYTGGGLGEGYAGSAFFGSWNEGTLNRVIGDVEGDGVNFTSAVELQSGPRGILDVMNGPDGHLYVSTQDGVFRVVIRESQDAIPGHPYLSQRLYARDSPIDPSGLGLWRSDWMTSRAPVNDGPPSENLQKS